MSPNNKLNKVNLIEAALLKLMLNFLIYDMHYTYDSTKSWCEETLLLSISTCFKHNMEFVNMKFGIH